jgi:hypothetical protein
MYKDEYGVYELQCAQEFDGKHYQWRKYMNSPRIKILGGQYANYCEDGKIKFYRNEYIRDKAFPKFTEEK